MKTVLIYFAVYFSVTDSQKLEDNVCYLGVKPKLNSLTDLYKNPPSISNVTTFPEIHSLIHEVEDIISNITNLDRVLEDSQTVNDDIGKEFTEVQNLKKVLNVLKSLMKELEELNQRKDIHNQAYDACSDAKHIYETLRKDIADIQKVGKDIKTAIEHNLKRMENIHNSSLHVKNDLDAIDVPVSIFEKYVCDANLQLTIESIIDYIRNIEDILRRKFQEILQQRLQEIKKDIDQTENDINDMEDSLKQDVPKTDISITNETHNNIDKLKEHLTILKNKLGNIELDGINDDSLKNVEEQFKNLRNEYEIILNYLFSEENLEKVKEELESARKTLKIVREHDALKKQLQEIKKIVDRLKEGGVCLKEKVDVEG